MTKRFTATDKWMDPWFCGLSMADKLFWIYLLDNCNHAGIWQVNPLLVTTYFPGYEIDASRFGGRVSPLSTEKWFIPKFIAFQYGELAPDNRAHASVLKILEKEGASKGLVSPYLGAKDKDKDCSKTSKTLTSSRRFVKPSPEEITAYAKSIGFHLDGHQFHDYYESKGWMVGRAPMKDWKAAVRTWKKNGFSNGNGKTSTQTKETPSWM